MKVWPQPTLPQEPAAASSLRTSASTNPEQLPGYMGQAESMTKTSRHDGSLSSDHTDASHDVDPVPRSGWDQRKGRRAVHVEPMHWKNRRSLVQARKAARKISVFVDSRFMLVSSVIVTIYALVSDDMRLLCTNKPADNWFNALAIVCLTFFVVELVLSSIGKSDYFLGFYFTLDIVATASLTLDLTWVSDALLGDDDLNMADSTRSGRSARLGASVARVVRVLRLIRIVKLYKAYFERKARKSRLEAEARRRSKEGERSATSDSQLWDDNWDGMACDEDGPGNQVHDESVVGRKLVSLTTRHVIVLVLVMLLVLPHLRVDTGNLIPSSAAWGADSVWEAFRQAEADSSRRQVYEDRLLKYAYYHNWFGSTTECPKDASCSSMYMSHAFWIGLAGQNLELLRNRSNEAQLRVLRVDAWDQAVLQRPLLYRFGSMPREVQGVLSSPWDQHCQYGGLDHLGISLLAEEVSGIVDHTVRCPGELRPQERTRIHPQLITRSQFLQWHFVFFFDARPFVREESVMSLLSTAFICVVLCISTLFFSRDANALVLHPVERMVEKVKIIANDPLIAIKMADAEFEFEEVQKYRQSAMRRKSSKYSVMLKTGWDDISKVLSCGSSTDRQEPMETVILEKTIIKLGGLLALGFGEAGAEIIGQNMKGGHSAGVEVLVPGQKVDAIIGFCNIRNFTMATEVLREKVMVFVNQVGEIVHGCVDDFHGAPNKNIGDSFLVVWRLSGVAPERQTKLADMAIMSFVRIQAEIHKSRVLAVYREHPGFLWRLPKFRVFMGFGLHCGWAIEGAIGSEFKIDASYLSPNVNVASRLEAATVQFGVWVLLSHFMFNLCSQEMAMVCRLIDHVTVKGSKQPIRLYTIDLDYMNLGVQQKQLDTRIVRNRFKVRQIREIRKSEKWADDFRVWESFATDPDLLAMRSTYSTEFFQRFAMAYRNYEAGEWMVARDMLYTCHYGGFGDGAEINPDAWPVDGPAVTLLGFMKQSSWIPASDWPGHRELLEK
mmetsp:Transcript_90346/g.255832  ORF Transcript_90346/g.255832 Transcript_90346/m.255832 type:complete len:1006 (-) Transcript_90346:28-3045(-)